MVVNTNWILRKLDWVGNIFLILGMWLVGDKIREAFIFAFIGELLWTYYAWKKKEYGLVFICIIFAILAARNWYRWGY